MNIPADIDAQLAAACAILEKHLAPHLHAIHLFGSALDGGLKPLSDVDLLVTVDGAPANDVRAALMRELLTASAPPLSSRWRALEVTVVSLAEVIPWRYPARRELQFGEWLRADIEAGIFEPPMRDNDLAILLTKVRQHSIALRGPAATALFEPVSHADFMRALADTLAQWNVEEDWRDDERNIVLALARIWYSAETGAIAPKDIAASWLLERIPAEHRAVLLDARAGYLGLESHPLPGDSISAFILHAKSHLQKTLPH